MPRYAVGLVLALILMSGTGCAFLGDPQHLVFLQKTTMGVDVAPAIETGSVHLVAGYKRQTVAYIPTATLDPDSEDPQSATPGTEQTEREAMSVIAKTEIRISFWRLPEIVECFATGNAAINLANDPFNDLCSLTTQGETTPTGDDGTEENGS